MRIVIIGEYSGFAYNLKDGFIKNGHDAFVYSWGDSFKQIDAGDHSYSIDVSNFTFFGRAFRGTGRIRRMWSAIKLNLHLAKKWKSEKADVILIINPAFLKLNNNPFIPLFSEKMIDKMRKPKAKLYLSACGNDYITNSYGPYSRKINEYGLYRYYDKAYLGRKSFEQILNFVRDIIPTMADYSIPYHFFEKDYNYIVHPTIPLSFDVLSETSKNEIKEKIVIMHGITRAHDKGSYIILAALDKLKKAYEDKIDVRIVERIPFSQYLALMAETNIIIDQCYGLGYGMNAIEALSMGKVVMGGNEIENQIEFGITDSPIVTIGPDADDIFKKLEILVNNPNLIKELSLKSRTYAEIVHDSAVVAKKYIELFEKNG